MVSVRSRPAPSPTGTPSPRPRGVGRLRPPVTMIECDFCGCSSPKPDKGWMAYPDEDVAGAPGNSSSPSPCSVTRSMKPM